MFKKRKSRSYETRSLAKMMKDRADRTKDRVHRLFKFLCWIGDILVILVIAILSIGFVLWSGI